MTVADPNTSPPAAPGKKTSRALKIMGIAGGLLLAIVLGLSLLVRSFLTEERLKGLLLPPAEKALGRSVDFSGVDVGLFSGISLNNLTVKEKEGSADFFTVKELVVRYQLLPLLKRRLVISEVDVREPVCRISRDAKGRFNFETLAFLEPAAKEAKKRSGETAKGAPAELPVSLTVDAITVEQARVTVSDALHQIPATEATADLTVSVDLGRDLASLTYRGTMDYTATMEYGELAPTLEGRATIDPATLTTDATLTAGGQPLKIAAKVSNWAGTPQVRLDLTAERLDCDRLLAALPAAGEAKTPPSRPEKKKTKKAPSAAARQGTKAAGTPIAAALPPNLTARGRVRIDELLYKGMTVSDLGLDYLLENGILAVEELTARTADGTVRSTATLDLTRPAPAYAGKVSVESLKPNLFLPHLTTLSPDTVTGALDTEIAFTGSGTTLPEIKKNLSVDATYLLADGRIGETPITALLARLLTLPELQSPVFEAIRGSLRLDHGAVSLKSLYTATDLAIDAKGTVGLEGALDLPMTIRFTGPLAEKMRQQASMLKYLSDENGDIRVGLAMTGTVDSPAATLDTKAVQIKLRKTLEEKAVKELERALDGSASPQDEPAGNGAAEPSPAKSILKLFKGVTGTQ